MIKQLSIEADVIYARMTTAEANQKDLKTQAQLKPYMPIMKARVVTLKNNLASFRSMGVQ